MNLTYRVHLYSHCMPVSQPLQINTKTPYHIISQTAILCWYKCNCTCKQQCHPVLNVSSALINKRNIDKNKYTIGISSIYILGSPRKLSKLILWVVKHQSTLPVKPVYYNPQSQSIIHTLGKLPTILDYLLKILSLQTKCQHYEFDLTPNF